MSSEQLDTPSQPNVGNGSDGNGNDDDSPIVVRVVSPTESTEGGASASAASEEPTSTSVVTAAERSKKSKKKKKKTFTEEEKEGVFKSVDERSQKEFDLIDIIPKVGVKSEVWTHICGVCLKDEAVNDDLALESKALKRVDTEEGVHICKLCVQEGKPLERCLVSCRNGPSNGQKHLEAVHKEQLAEIKAEREKAQNEANKKNGVVTKKRNQTSLVFGPQQESMPNAKKQKTSTTKKEKQKEAVQKLQKLIVRYVNNSANPDRTVEDPNFRDVIEYCINKGHLLTQYRHMGRAKFHTIRCNNFVEFVSKVTDLLGKIRQFYVDRTGKRMAFIGVGHDVWDGKRKQINGITLFFIDPTDMVMYRIPIALLKPIGKSAIELSRTNMHGLERYGIDMDDLYRSVNDNCTTAVAAGVFTLVGADEKADTTDVPRGKCDMHKAHLMAGLAVTLVKRTSGGKVINRWKPFHKLYNKTIKMAKWIFGAKNKEHFEMYVRVLQLVGKLVNMVDLPCDTRVSSALRLLQGCLCAMHSLKLFAMNSTTFYPLFLSPEEWQQLAEFEGIMRKAFTMCMTVQEDRPEASCESVLELSLLKMVYEDDEVWDVVDTSASHSWTANTPFKDLPRISMTRKAEDATSSMPLLSKHSIELIGRYVQSIDEYFSKLDPDSLMSMILHPCLATKGFEELLIIRPDDGKDLMNQARKLLTDAALNAAEKMKPLAPASSGSDNAEASVAQESSSTPNPSTPATSTPSRFEKLKQLRAEQAKKAKKSPVRVALSTEEAVEKAVTEYMAHDFDPVTELRAQRVRMDNVTVPAGSTIEWETLDDALYEKYMPDVDWEKIRAMDLMYFSKQFDLLEWWKNVGMVKYPLLFPVAPPALAIPTHNAFLERIFSVCTWFDDPIRQRLKFPKFEMSVLLAVNETFLSNEVPTEDEAKEIVKKAISILQKADPTLDVALDLGLDLEANDFQADEEEELTDEEDGNDD